MTSMMKKGLIVLIIGLALLASFNVGFKFGQLEAPPEIIFGVENAELEKPESVDFSLFWETWNTLHKEYVTPGIINNQKMVYGAISGMVKSLEDPYTVFFSPEDSKIFKEDVTGSFEGVGMEIGIRKGELTIISPLEGTPAQKAGLRAGDKIIKVGDDFTRDMNIEKVVKLIRGPKGTEITLTVSRKEWDESKEIKITRGVIEVPSIKWELVGSNKDIAYIKLYQFTEKADKDFRKTAIEILNSPAKKIILDLRNNPGGYLEVSQNISGWFLKKNDLVVIEDFGEKKQKEYKSNGPSSLLNYPLVVLINEGSASASEILAGALRDDREVPLIGQTSFGKGSVQQLEELRDGSSLKITIAKWLTPNGDHITDKGLEPDIKVKLTEEDYDNEKDPQLDKAVEIIKDLY